MPRKPPAPPAPSSDEPLASPDQAFYETDPFGAPPTLPADEPPPPLSGLASSEIRKARSPRPPSAPTVVPTRVGEPPGADELEWVTAGEPIEPGLRRPRSSRLTWILGGSALAAAIVAAVLVYRANHQRAVLTQGMARALSALAADTAHGYREASQLLGPLSEMDPVEAGSLRAFACAMLALDYRDSAQATLASSLLEEPERAPQVPAFAHLAKAALALGRKEAGTVTKEAGFVSDAWSNTLAARSALVLDNLNGAGEYLEAALAMNPELPAALALKGDVLRRQRNYAAARASYTEALKASPLHPRAAYGLAKLALAGRATIPEALAPLERLIQDESTPANERGRAALHLGALRARLNQPAKAAEAIQKAGVSASARPWLERAMAREELDRSAYHAVAGAPESLRSTSDDDPAERAAAPAPAPAARPVATVESPKPIEKAPVKKAAAPSKKKQKGTKGTKAAKTKKQVNGKKKPRR